MYVSSYSCDYDYLETISIPLMLEDPKWFGYLKLRLMFRMKICFRLSNTKLYRDCSFSNHMTGVKNCVLIIFS